MRKMTGMNMQNALAGESQAHVRYRNFSERAGKDGFANVARLFAAAAASEEIHASNHLKALEGVQATAANLAAAVDGENFEVEDMYPSYIAVAEKQEERTALRSMHHALEAEKIHLDLYRRAAASVAEGKDIGAVEYYICPVCGYTMEGAAADVCPFCGTKHDKYIQI
jgi:rubrerythrin